MAYLTTCALQKKKKGHSDFKERSLTQSSDHFRILDMENRIGAGLIEEVIQVAEGELKLVDTMLEAKV